MRIAENWKDYKIIDTSSGDKLESWGGKVLVRPDPQIIWKSPKRSDLWTKADGIYHRSSKGGGEWEYRKRLPESWNIGYKNLKFIIRPTGFKHTGLFPEQAVNWDFMADKIRNAGREIKVLNLFAYTGGATLACPKQVQAFHTLTHPRAWCSGQERTPLCQGFPISLFAGLWTIAKSSFSVRYAVARPMTLSLWILRPTAEDLAERYGSLKIVSMTL